MSASIIDPLRIETVSRALTAAMEQGNESPYSLAFALEVAGLLSSAPAVTDLATAVDVMGALPMPTGESKQAHRCSSPSTQWLSCGHCPHEVCQDCDRCPHSCRCAELEKTTPSAGAEVTAAVATARTVVLTALARAMREHPTAGRVLDGLDELGEAVVQEDLDAARSWVDGISLLVGLPAIPDTGLTYYLASHDSIAVGRYTTEAVARRHCETLLSNEHPAGTVLIFDWIGDESAPEDPWELVVQIAGGAERPTGYVVHAGRIEAEFDPDAEW